jgi:phage terminase small subunit
MKKNKINTNRVFDQKISPQMLLFVNHYVVCMNGTEAARLAGYRGDDATLAATASRLLRNHKILNELSRQLELFTMPAQEVLVHLTDIARGDIADALNSLGAVDPLEAKRRGKSHLIKRFKTKTVTSDDNDVHEVEIEMYDRLDALKTLAKFHALLIDRVKVDDWRSQAIEDIRKGRIEYGVLANTFDESLAQELFRLAGVRVE